MKKIIKLRENDEIPMGAVHLKTIREPDESKSYKHEWQTAGFMHTYYHWKTITPDSTFHYYELSEEL